jgi:hypothetical protein
MGLVGVEVFISSRMAASRPPPSRRPMIECDPNACFANFCALSQSARARAGTATITDREHNRVRTCAASELDRWSRTRCLHGDLVEALHRRHAYGLLAHALRRRELREEALAHVIDPVGSRGHLRVARRVAQHAADADARGGRRVAQHAAQRKDAAVRDVEICILK